MGRFERNMRKADRLAAEGDVNATDSVIDQSVADAAATDAFLTGDVDEAADAADLADVADSEAAAARADYDAADRKINKAYRRS